MADSDDPRSARGDEAELFHDFNSQLIQNLERSALDASPEVIEEACAFAWAQFLEHQPDRDRNWRGWLFRTAQRQAWLLERQARDHRPLETNDIDGDIAHQKAISPIEEVEQRHDVREALTIISRLPPRLQRAALALDDYRSAAGPAEFEAMSAEPPADPALRVPHAAAVRAIEELDVERRRERGGGRER